MKDIEFFTDINDLYDVNTKALKNAISAEKVNGKLTLVAENSYKVLVLFFEDDNGQVTFYSYNIVTGLSRAYKARNLEAAVSKASCLDLFNTSTGVIKSEKAACGVQEIDKKKLGIDYSLERFPKEKKPEKIKESVDLYKKFLNDICDSSCNIMGNEDALFFTQKDHNIFLMKGLNLEELDDAGFTPQEMWDAISSGKAIADNFEPVSYKDYTLTLQLKEDK